MRAERAEDALALYKQALGGAGPIDTSTLRDLLQDTLHWLAKDGHDHPDEALSEACTTACRDFPQELKEDQDR